MASYSDNIQALSTFTPYIQQQPIEQMAAVGAQKQQQYEQGVEKIQSHVDKVAGLSVGRDVDKKYLQSAMGKLSNNLLTVAAGDFSNSQLVNSVTGLTKKVANDPFIIAAVTSTARDSKNLEEMEKAKKDGTLTPQAAYNYALQRQQYYGNESLTDNEGAPVTFNGAFNKGWDIEKNMLEEIKAIGDSKFTVDNIFERDPQTKAILHDYKYIKDKDGKTQKIDLGPKYSEYATREIREGRFSENVAAAINGVLSRPEAQQEMSMRAIYNYQGKDDINDFIVQYEQEKQEGIKLIEDRRLDIMAKKLEEEAKPKELQNPEDLAILEKGLIQLDENLNKLKSQQDPRIAEAEEASSLDAYKINLYTQRQYNNWLKQYTTEKTSLEVIENIPYNQAVKRFESDREAKFKEKSLDLQQQGVNISLGNLRLAEAKMRQEADQWKTNKNNVYAPGNTTAPATLPPIIGGNSPYAALGDILENVDETTTTFIQNRRGIIADYLVITNQANGKKLTKEQALLDVDKLSKSNPAWQANFYEKAKKIITNGKHIPAYSPLISSLERMQKNERDVVDAKYTLDAIENDPRVIQFDKSKEINELEKQLKPVTLTLDNRSLFGGNIEKITITPSDMLDFTMMTKDPNNKEKIHAKLVNKFGDNFIKIHSAINSANVGDKNTNQVLSKNASILSKIQDNVSKGYYDAMAKVAEEYSQTHKRESFPLYTLGTKGEDKSTINNNVKAVLGQYKQAGEDVSAFDAYFESPDKTGTNLQFDVKKGTTLNPKNTVELALYDGKKKIKSIEVTPEHAKYITGKDLGITPVVSRVATRLNYGPERRTTNSNTAYITSPDAYYGAYYKPQDFNIKGVSENLAGADLYKNDKGEINIYFYKKSGKNVQPVPVKDPHGKIAAFNSADAAETYLNSFTSPNQINTILNR